MLFKPQGQIHATNEYWAHTIEIPIPQMTGPTATSSPCVKEKLPTPVCQLLQAARLQALKVRNTTSSMLNDTMIKIKNMLPEVKVQSSDSRGKRSLLPFIGQLSHSLFGTATEQDVRLLGNHIKRLESSTKALFNVFQHDIDNQASFMATVDKRISNAVSGIEMNHKAIIELGRNLWYTDHQLVLQARITGHVSHLVQMSTLLMFRAEELLQGVVSLTLGKLPPLLVTPHLIRQIIQQIQNRLHTKYQVIHTSPEFYYENRLFVFGQKNGKIYITLKFPFSTENSTLKVYQIKTVPVPVNHSSDHGTQLLDLPKYMAINSARKHYLLLSETDFYSCKGHIHKFCPTQLSMIPVSTPSCTSALFLKNKASILETCNFRFRFKAMTSSLMLTSPGKALATNISDIRLKCEKNSKLLKGCQFCIIKVPCGCKIYGENIYLPPLFHSCMHPSDNITKIFPVNLAILQHFFHPDKHELINPDTLFKNEITIKIPNFQIFDHKFSKLLASDQQSHLSLKRMAEATKSEQKIYKSLSEPLIEGTLDINADPPFIIYTALGISSCLAVSAAITACLALRKFKMMALVLATLQKTCKAEAVSEFTGSFVYSQTTPSTELSNVSIKDLLTLPSYLTMPIVGLIILVIVLVVILAVRKRRHTILMLEITAGEDCVLINIKNLPICPTFWHFKASKSLTDIDIEGFWRNKMRIDWGDLKITNFKSSQNISLPDSNYLSPWNSLKLQRILRKPFNASLLFSHQGLAMNANICPNSGCPHDINERKETSLYPTLDTYG